MVEVWKAVRASESGIRIEAESPNREGRTEGEATVELEETTKVVGGKVGRRQCTG